MNYGYSKRSAKKNIPNERDKCSGERGDYGKRNAVT
jgi:hypothetical protein